MSECTERSMGRERSVGREGRERMPKEALS